MKSFLSIAVLLLIAVIGVSAQDTVKITVAFQNLNVANQNLPGGNASMDFKLGGYGNWRLGAVADVAYHRDTDRLLDRYQLLGGPQIAYTFGEDRMSIFGRGMFGVTRFDQKNSNLQDFARATVSIGGGVDVNFGKFFVRPLQFDFQYIDQRPVRYTRLGAGGGFRF